MSPGSISAEDGNVLLNLRTLLLHNTLTDPGEVTDLLQLQMSIAIVGSYM